MAGPAPRRTSKAATPERAPAPAPAPATSAASERARAALPEAQAAVPRPPAPAPPHALTARDGTSIDPRSLLFDPQWYRAEYPDVATVGVDPVRHYLERGWSEGRKPNPHFDTRHYMTAYPDVLAAGHNPFLHYVLYGAFEGRRPSGAA